MKRIWTAGLAIMVAALVLAAAWIASATSTSAGGSPTISVDSATLAVGSSASVDLNSLNMASPGLGAWSLNIVYNPDILTQGGCTAQNGSVCNPAFASDTIRVSGATAAGLIGDAVLASLNFTCDTTGTSALQITIDTLADGTPGAPADIDATVMDGSITCVVPTTPTVQPPPAGGNGFPAAGGTYVGNVPGEGTIVLVIEPNGQGISRIQIIHLVTVCGTIDQALSFDPPLDIQEPGFHYDLFALSEGAATLSLDGFFAENGTIPVNLIINTDNVDFPGGQSPCTSNNQVIPLVLVRQAPPVVTPPPSGGGNPPPTCCKPSGGGLPNAGTGDGSFGLNPTSPITWIVAAMIGAGVAWLSAGVAGAGLAAVSSGSSSPERSTSKRRGFMPRMRPLRHSANSRPSVDYSVLTPRVEKQAPAPAQQRARSTRNNSPDIDKFEAPRRPDRR